MKVTVPNAQRKRKLWQGLLLDAIGMASFFLPVLGDVIDVFWAPLAGWLMTKMYKGRVGQIAGIVTLLEELVPGPDLIPTFTIMWLYTYIFNKDKTPL
ncbi:MAG: hypothetical protein AAGF77_13090 [Bacteroidota bacterium]